MLLYPRGKRAEAAMLLNLHQKQLYQNICLNSSITTLKKALGSIMPNNAKQTQLTHGYNIDFI